MDLVQHFLESTADRIPAKVALACDGARYTYGELDAMANRLAHALRDAGVRRGDRVILFLPNGLELVVAIFAVLKADGVFVVNQATKPERLQSVAANCGATVVIAPRRQVGDVQRIAQQIDSLTRIIVTDDASNLSLGGDNLTSWGEIQSYGPSSRPLCSAIDVDLACLSYTSGSRGEPKGVMTSHDNVNFVSASVISYLRNVPDDVILCALPLSFGYGLYQLLMAFRLGATLVLERSFAYIGQILRQLAHERVTGLPGVPTMFNMLLDSDTSAFDLSQLRYATNAAAALPTSRIEEFARRFPHVDFYSMYGLTETKRALYMPPDQLAKRPGSVGIAIPGTEVWLVDEFDRRLGPEETGELVVRGRHVMRGYWGDPAGSDRRFRQGLSPGERVCYSGDLFRRDAQGYYYFVSRKDDIIKCRGEKVAPQAVEDVLHRLPQVVEAAVVGVPDAMLGEAVKAFIVKRTPELQTNDVLRHCKQFLEDHMIPSRIVFLDELPRSANGKVQKSRLVEIDGPA